MGLFGKSSGFNSDKSIGEKAARAARFVWRLVFFPFRALWKAAAFAAKLTATWWKDRKMVHLLRGIPTLLLAGMCVYFIVGMRAGTSRGEAYREAGMAASNTGNWDNACLFLKRAYGFGIQDNETLFTLAKAAESSNDRSTMVTMLNRLAPADRPVHLPAHLWKATQVLTAGPITKEQVDEAKIHLEHVLAINPDHRGANALLGDIYFQQNLWHAAVEYLERAHPRSAKYRLMLAKACLQIQDRIRAERYVREAQKLAKARCDREPENIQARLLWADATTVLEEYPEAIRILTETLSIEENQQLRMGLTRVYIHWADSIEGGSAADAHRRYTLLAEGMKHYPDDAMLFDRMQRLMQRQGEAADEARAFLLRNIVEGRAVGISHLMLGTAAWGEDDKQSAAVHLERAFTLIPNAATVANNFAWYLANKDSPEPERALKMIEPILERTPENHYIRDTRGQIYLKLGRWADAVDDLEFAAQKLRTNNQTQQGLATAYRQLGLTDLAGEHERAAKMLEKRQAP